MISPRNKEQAGLHIAKDTQISQANIVGFIRPSKDQPSQHSLKTNHCIHTAKHAIHSLDKGKRSLSRSWPYRGQKDPMRIHIYSKCSWNHSKQVVGKATGPNPNTKATGEENTAQNGGEDPILSLDRGGHTPKTTNMYGNTDTHIPECEELIQTKSWVTKNGSSTRYVRNNPSLRMRGRERISVWGWARMESFVVVFPAYVRVKSLLAEWACGKGLTILPHPPLPSNNYPN